MFQRMASYVAGEGEESEESPRSFKSSAKQGQGVGTGQEQGVGQGVGTGQEQGMGQGQGVGGAPSVILSLIPPYQTPPYISPDLSHSTSAHHSHHSHHSHNSHTSTSQSSKSTSQNSQNSQNSQKTHTSLASTAQNTHNSDTSQNTHPPPPRDHTSAVDTSIVSQVSLGSLSLSGSADAVAGTMCV
ncbi:hypothetical protein B484DRAFT_123401 [Ochromonadaceae sp. CCMP2298]|nr:hypothetical protein B484DRAFT_123401 [Ochromonadaceae sp. CCMP2298]